MTQKTWRGRNIRPLRSDEKWSAIEQFPSYPLLSQHIVSSCVRHTNTPFQDCLFVFPLNQGLQPICVRVLRPSGGVCFLTHSSAQLTLCASWYLVSYLMPANAYSVLTAATEGSAWNKKPYQNSLLLMAGCFSFCRKLSITSSVWREMFSCRGKFENVKEIHFLLK